MNDGVFAPDLEDLKPGSRMSDANMRTQRGVSSARTAGSQIYTPSEDRQVMKTGVSNKREV